MTKHETPWLYCDVHNCRDEWAGVNIYDDKARLVCAMSSYDNRDKARATAKQITDAVNAYAVFVVAFEEGAAALERIRLGGSIESDDPAFAALDAALSLGGPQR